MAPQQELGNLLRSLKSCNRNNQILKDIASSIHYADKSNCQLLLELINTTNDLQLQVKLVSVLSVYLLTNDANIDIIITCNLMYEKIKNILLMNPPQKNSGLFNFLTLLLHTDIREPDTSRRKSLAMYARNMIRISGCLAVMCEIFISAMMYKDIWPSLCVCLAEICNGIEVNQTFCTNLVPSCIQRCSQGNDEVIPLLKSLLSKHERNVQLFIERDGFTIFRRETLQYDAYMELLCSIVKTSTQGALQIQNTDIFQSVQEILRLYGPHCQIGKWATIILYYGDSKMKGQTKDARDNVNVDLSNLHKTLSSVTNLNTIKSTDENTTVLFQNVMNEVLNWRPTNNMKYSNTFVAKDMKSSWVQCDKNANTPVDPLQSDIMGNLNEVNNLASNDGSTENRNYDSNNLSFSFIQKQHFSGKREIYDYDIKQQKQTDTQIGNKIEAKKSQYNFKKICGKSTITICRSNPSVINNSFVRGCINENSVLDMRDFQPKFTSTPNNSQSIIKSNKTDISYKSNVRNKQIRDNVIVKNKNSKQRQYKNTLKNNTVVSELKQRSISSKFFDAINESCTTLVKTVKNIFTAGNTSPLKFEEENLKNESCSYSFTKYMHNRDALLIDNWTRGNDDVFEDFSVQNDSCRTCNDTITLKSKMINDKYLKRTVKKLKLGINLYGCDFKKISKTMWPRQTYMTPVVLYNLYRKLIMK